MLADGKCVSWNFIRVVQWDDVFQLTAGCQVDQQATGLADERYGAAQWCAARYYDAVGFFIHGDAKRLHIQLCQYSKLSDKHVHSNLRKNASRSYRTIPYVKKITFLSSVCLSCRLCLLATSCKNY